MNFFKHKNLDRKIREKIENFIRKDLRTQIISKNKFLNTMIWKININNINCSISFNLIAPNNYVFYGEDENGYTNIQYIGNSLLKLKSIMKEALEQ